MEIKSKFKVGQAVCLFNSVSLKIEHDEVFAILVAPQAVEGKTIDSQKEISKSLAAGEAEVKVQYQLQYHQGILDEEVLFASEDDCRGFFREFFSK